jgi:hypothetical protein
VVNQSVGERIATLEGKAESLERDLHYVVRAAIGWNSDTRKWTIEQLADMATKLCGGIAEQQSLMGASFNGAQQQFMAQMEQTIGVLCNRVVQLEQRSVQSQDFERGSRQGLEEGNRENEDVGRGHNAIIGGDESAEAKIEVGIATEAREEAQEETRGEEQEEAQAIKGHMGVL